MLRKYFGRIQPQFKNSTLFKKTGTWEWILIRDHDTEKEQKARKMV